MTTTFLTIKFAKFRNSIVMEFPPEKECLWTIFRKLSPSPTPSKTQILLVLSFRRLWYSVFYSVSELRRACFRQARVAQAVLLPGALFHAWLLALPSLCPQIQKCPLPHLGLSEFSLPNSHSTCPSMFLCVSVSICPSASVPLAVYMRPLSRSTKGLRRGKKNYAFRDIEPSGILAETVRKDIGEEL